MVMLQGSTNTSCVIGMHTIDHLFPSKLQAPWTSWLCL
jgi:hypothetical protein